MVIIKESLTLMVQNIHNIFYTEKYNLAKSILISFSAFLIKFKCYLNHLFLFFFFFQCTRSFNRCQELQHSSKTTFSGYIDYIQLQSLKLVFISSLNRSRRGERFLIMHYERFRVLSIALKRNLILSATILHWLRCTSAFNGQCI